MLRKKGFQMVLVINVESSAHVLTLAAGVLFGITICCEETIQRNGVCAVGYTDFLPSSKYCFLNGRDDTLNWTSSRKKCQGYKGDLATFSTVNDRIYFSKKGFHGYWFGFYWISALQRPVSINYYLFNRYFINVQHDPTERDGNCGELYVYARSKASQIHYTECHIRKKYMCQKLKDQSSENN